jgi:nicotinamide mononucleotide transporter
MSPIEIAAALLGLLSVYYTLREHVWCWPTGLVNVVLYVVVFFDAKLYADTLLQVVYIVLQIYGWYEWLHGGPAKTELRISRSSGRSLALLLLLAAGVTLGMGYGFDRYTDAALPYWDSAITALSLVAQWMVAKKRLENWVFWIVVDVLAIGVYFTKQLLPTAALYGVFLVMAVMGLRAWRKAWIKQQSEARAMPPVANAM